MHVQCDFVKCGFKMYWVIRIVCACVGGPMHMHANCAVCCTELEQSAVSQQPDHSWKWKPGEEDHAQ